MLYSYVITRDYGFAPNPFYGLCTLATCKPQIRKKAQVGDWIAGFGGSDTPCAEKLVYIMRVDRVMSFDDYWGNTIFINKRPCFHNSIKACYGDNIYHSDGDGTWYQENSHHSYENKPNYINLEHDTSVDRVLVSSTYWYFGDRALCIPEELSSIVKKGRGHKKVDDDLCDELVLWIKKQYAQGVHGIPFSWKNSFERFAGERQ